MKEILKHTILAIAFLNLPLFGLVAFGSAFGSAIAALFLVAPVLYYFFIKKSKPMLPLLILGILYYTISGLNYSGDVDIYIKDAFKYFLFIICITEVVKNTTNKEAIFYLFIGALSVIIHALLFSGDYGRYSGLYINPNTAGFICILGFALTHTLLNKKHKLIGQLIFTIAGLATLSRTFIVLLIVINVISIFANRKNAIGLLAIIIGFIIILNTPAFNLKNKRFQALQSIFSNEKIQTETITEESRDETWALYTDVILNNIPIGSGYRSMQGTLRNNSGGISTGVHNSYLMVLGESGVIPFLVLVILYLSLLFKSLKQFSTKPEYTYLSIIFLLNLMVTHGFFYHYVLLYFTIWLYAKLFMNVDENKLENE